MIDMELDSSSQAVTDKTMDLIRRQRSTAKMKFTRKHNIFLENIHDDHPLSILQSNYEQVKNAYQEVERVHERYVDLLCATEVNDDMLEVENIYILELEKRKNDDHILLAKKGETNVSINGSNSKSKVKVKAIEPPIFDGDIRNYPSFKADFERIVNNSFGKDPFALKQCLSGEALKTVRGVEDDYEQMFKRLDEKYGNCRKVVDVVLCDLKSLRKITEGDAKGFIRMVDKVEQCWLDLKKMDLTAEMNTSNMVSHIEKILPVTQKREWVIRAEQIDSKNIFKELLEFLLKEKRVLEYMDSSIRSIGNFDSKASVHGVAVNELETNMGSTIEVVNAIKHLQQSQETQSKKLEQCMVNLSQLVTNMKVNRNSEKVGRACGIPRCWLHSTDTHSIIDCTTFYRMNNYDKIEALKYNGICFNCLLGAHPAKNCSIKKACDVKGSTNVACGRFHHPLLHQAHVEGMLFHTTSHTRQYPRLRKTTLLMVSKVHCNMHPITALWDPGSDTTLITHKLASKLGLKGRDVDLMMTKVGNSSERFCSKEYDLPLTDTQGNIWHIKAIGMSEISSKVCEVEVSELVPLFTGITYNDIERPSGNIDLLVGTDHCELLPQVIKTKGKLQLLKNQFGYCIRGSHPYLTSTNNNSNHIRVKINHLATLTSFNDIKVEPTFSIKSNLDHFFDVESLGTTCVPKCGGCKCGKCAIGNHDYTIKEERELAMIEKGLEYNKDTQRWIVTYPWVKDPNILPNNVMVAISKMKATEKRLYKLGPEYTQLYQDQIDDMVSRGVCRKINYKELVTYHGPIHYVQHHEIHKPDSTSTPLRLVFNSSASYMGHVLNNYWCKGPNVMNNLLGVMLRFRQNAVAIVGDISKMYHTIGLSELDQHTHRFVWRDMDVNRRPDHYVLTAVAFGDRPSGTIAMLALRHTAEMNKNTYPEVAKMIIGNTYVDDILYSTNSSSEAYEMIKNAEKVLLTGNFKVKHWIISGFNSVVTDINLLSTEKEKVLGLQWNPKKDQFSYKVQVNFSPKYRKIYTALNLTKNDIKVKLPDNVTRRMLLSQIASIYDPLGLVTPFTLQAKVLMRNMITENRETPIAWDDPLSDLELTKWHSFFLELFDLEMISFKRCLKPSNAKGNPTLVIYSDGSTQAYGTCAYVRWELDSGFYKSNIIVAKNRIAPTRQLSIPRLELCGAVLASRLRSMIETEFDWKFEDIIHITDSAIVRAQIQKESHGFNTFVATRIAEIQSKTKPSDWWWVSSENNPADLTTRPTAPMNLNSDSVWQNGPSYLSRPMSTWPICKSPVETLPDRVSVTFTCAIQEKHKHVDLRMLNVKHFSNYKRLIRVTCYLLSIVKNKSFKGAISKCTPSLFEESEMLWIREVQRAIPSDWVKRYQRLGPSQNNDGIIIVGHRISKWLKDNWNCEYYVLLTRDHPFTEIYIQYLHNIDHSGVEVTLTKLQNRFWVPGARRLIKLIKGRCVTCKRWEKKCEGQIMGQMVSERLKPSPPFYHTAIDLFGPFQIKDTVKRRTKGKAYGIVFNCLVSRAVYIDLADGYDTCSFLKTFRRFVSLRGFPNTVYSDGGTQLVAASKELRLMVKDWDSSEILQFGSNNGMTWSFNKAADAPWQNGCSEALIKMIKRSIRMSIGDSVLTYGELQTVLFEVANLLNERPIGMKPGMSIELGRYLCPNDLVLGRASVKVPFGKLDSTDDPKYRLNYIQGIVDSFWKRWQRDYFPTLIVRQKWHESKRNMKIGDIVLVQDTNLIRGKWKLAQVVVANSGQDGVVRNVSVRYKTQKPGKGYSGQEDMIVNRSVHKLVVLIAVEEQ